VAVTSVAQRRSSSCLCSERAHVRRWHGCKDGMPRAEHVTGNSGSIRHEQGRCCTRDPLHQRLARRRRQARADALTRTAQAQSEKAAAWEGSGSYGHRGHGSCHRRGLHDRCAHHRCVHLGSGEGRTRGQGRARAARYPPADEARAVALAACATCRSRRAVRTSIEARTEHFGNRIGAALAPQPPIPTVDLRTPASTRA